MHLEQYVPIVEVSGFVFAKDGDILLYRSSFSKNHYSLPIGGVHLGETREQAFQRVVREQLKVEIQDVRYALTIDSIFSDEYLQKSHFVIHEYLAHLSLFQDKNDVRVETGDNFVWLPPHYAETLQLTRETKIMIDWYLREKK